MIERGKIREIRGNSLIIDRESDIACFGCMDRECKARAFSYSAENTAGLPLKPGQLVETETAASPLKQGLGALLPPLLGFVAGYALPGLAIPAPGEPLRAATGALLLFAVAGILYLVRRRHPPRIIRRVVRVAGVAGGQ
jgi:sigma-E factor negative regulatory protein RseC